MINITTLSDNINIVTINKNFKKNSDLWQIEIVDSNGETGWFSNIKVIDSENVYISYYERLSNSLKIAKYINSNWTTETVDSNGDVGTYTSIAVDSIGNPHISYYDIKNQDLKYAKWDGNSWILNIVDSYGNVGLDTSIKIDTNDYPHISYYDSTNGNLKYAKWTGLKWEIEIVDSESNVGAGTSLEIDNEGNPHISYKIVLEKGLKYAYKTDTGWKINNIDPDSFVYWSTSISLDQDSNPHIAYFDVGTNSEEWYLKYAYLKKNVWIIEIIDPKMKNFWYDWGVSIDASNEDIIHIGYYKWTERDMNYAWKINNKWSKETIDSYGAVGAYASIDIGPDGYPQISYMDRSNLILKYAKKIQYAPSTPQIPTVKNYGLINKEYTFTTISSDYEGEKIKYGWDWGDSSNIEWTDYYDSNKTVEITHSWTEKGTYQIRVKAVDINGYESEWSDRLIFKTSLFFPKNQIWYMNSYYFKIINYQNQNS